MDDKHAFVYVDVKEVIYDNFKSSLSEGRNDTLYLSTALFPFSAALFTFSLLITIVLIVHHFHSLLADIY